MFRSNNGTYAITPLLSRKNNLDSMEALSSHRSSFDSASVSANDSRRGSAADKIMGASQDLFELLEKLQNSRLDDQRCVLPSYFTQIPLKTSRSFKKSRD
ncbi:unnamed protein product [Allacma fusca]|uniref:Uncharacterized protein n=1 Tax=Allacma fusca TaxID=39272 RepID=A0A8J2KYU3_9HEXA|nr:unnamed protein product [Allacma fusca]